ncbi:MAG: hypothetical protein RLN77_08775 [Rhodospirillales bacterium]
MGLFDEDARQHAPRPADREQGAAADVLQPVMLGELFLDQRRRLADVAADGVGQAQMAERQGRVGPELPLV